MLRSRIVKEDKVQVLTGRDKGKQGRVLSIDRQRGRVLVEHVMMVKKHVRPNPQKQIKGGIAESEAYFAVSNVKIVCGTCGPVRIGVDVAEDGTRTRVCRRCGTTLEKKRS